MPKHLLHASQTRNYLLATYSIKRGKVITTSLRYNLNISSQGRESDGRNQLSY